MSAQELVFTIRLDDGSTAEARAWDPAAVERLRKVIREPAADRKRLRIRTAPEGDTAGHELANDTTTVNIALEYDVEGHTFALRFPSAEEAKRFQKRLLITGVLAASIVAGAAGAELATQSQAHIGPASGPAITVRAPSSNVTPGSIDARLRDASEVTTNRVTPGSIDAQLRDGSAVTTNRVTPGSIDAQLRDESAVSGTTTGPISSAKDAKDAAASGGSSATDSTTDSSLGAPTNQTYPK